MLSIQEKKHVIHGTISKIYLFLECLSNPEITKEIDKEFPEFKKPHQEFIEDSTRAAESLKTKLQLILDTLPNN